MKAPKHILGIAAVLAIAVAACDSRVPRSKATGATLEQQKMCADGAWEQFHRLGWDKPQPEFVEVHYQNHYDEARKQCFMEIVTTTTDGTTGDVILDAFEGKWYGSYMQTLKGGLDCEVLDGSSPKKVCASKDQFDAWKKAYIP